jgi:hypothetical protein
MYLLFFQFALQTIGHKLKQVRSTLRLRAKEYMKSYYLAPPLRPFPFPFFLLQITLSLSFITPLHRLYLEHTLPFTHSHTHSHRTLISHPRFFLIHIHHPHKENASTHGPDPSDSSFKLSFHLIHPTFLITSHSKFHSQCYESQGDPPPTMDPQDRSQAAPLCVVGGKSLNAWYEPAFRRSFQSSTR